MTETEGELYKRLRDSHYVEDSSIVSSYEMEKLFDTAKKDFPVDVSVVDGQVMFFITKDNPLSPADVIKLSMVWFEKWFGGK